MDLIENIKKGMLILIIASAGLTIWMYMAYRIIIQNYFSGALAILALLIAGAIIMTLAIGVLVLLAGIVFYLNKNKNKQNESIYT